MSLVHTLQRAAFLIHPQPERVGLRTIHPFRDPSTASPPSRTTGGSRTTRGQAPAPKPQDHPMAPSPPGCSSRTSARGGRHRRIREREPLPPGSPGSGRSRGSRPSETPARGRATRCACGRSLRWPLLQRRCRPTLSRGIDRLARCRSELRPGNERHLARRFRAPEAIQKWGLRAAREGGFC